MEQLPKHPLEVAAETIKSIGMFVIVRIQGGGWAELNERTEE